MTRPLDGAPRVLVLDDDPLILRAIERAAASRGDVVLRAVATPDDARERVRGATAPFDLILCDFQLKAIGADVTSEALVRELHGRGERVVIATADPSAACAAVGELVPIVRKPFGMDELLAHVLRRTDSSEGP